MTARTLTPRSSGTCDLASLTVQMNKCRVGVGHLFNGGTLNGGRSRTRSLGSQDTPSLTAWAAFVIITKEITCAFISHFRAHAFQTHTAMKRGGQRVVTGPLTISLGLNFLIGGVRELQLMILKVSCTQPCPVSFCLNWCGRGSIGKIHLQAR